VSVYLIAQLTFSDRKAYARYQERFMDMLRPFRGKLLAADEDPDVLEGSLAIMCHELSLELPRHLRSALQRCRIQRGSNSCIVGVGDEEQLD
jgi:uncharacterized protein (DUF1330 family)